MPAWDETVQVAFGNFTVDLPAALVSQRQQAVDSPAATFEGEGLKVILDAGPFADRLESHLGRPDYREELTELGGVVGRIVSFRNPDGTETLASHVPPPASVTVVVHADASVPQHVARQIIESLRKASPA